MANANQTLIAETIEDVEALIIRNQIGADREAAQNAGNNDLLVGYSLGATAVVAAIREHGEKAFVPGGPLESLRSSNDQLTRMFRHSNPAQSIRAEGAAVAAADAIAEYAHLITDRTA